MSVEDFPQLPKSDYMDIALQMIKENNFEESDYASLIYLIAEGHEFMSWLSKALSRPFADDVEGLYRDFEALLMARDYLSNQYARAVSLYRASKKRFLPASGTTVDKESFRDFKTSPYKFYETALEEKIKTLDNRCTAAKQQQRLMEEAMKRSLMIL